MNIKELFSLKNKVAIITGASRGLGLMMAEGFAEAGARVVICSRNLDACEQAATNIRKSGAECHALRCDVTNNDEIDNLTEYTLDQFGTIDILVNNAGMAWGDELEAMPIERWDQLYQINVRGTFLCTRAVGKHMIKKRSGKIINIASMSALKPIDPAIAITPAYASTKGAIIALTKNLARYWAKHNINVNAIAPGIFPTEMSRSLVERKREVMEAAVPLGRFGEKDDFKGVAVFLAAPASNYMTGHILTVDGGALV